MTPPAEWPVCMKCGRYSAEVYPAGSHTWEVVVRDYKDVHHNHEVLGTLDYAAGIAVGIMLALTV